MSANKEWVVTANDDRPLHEVAKELTSNGFAVGQILDSIGCITGAASDDVVAKVRNVRGVADVSQEPQIDIGPPGQSITW